VVDAAANSRLADKGTNVAFQHYLGRHTSILSWVLAVMARIFAPGRCGPPPFFERRNMADSKTRQAADRRRIDVHEPYELGYWSRKFGVSREELADAVRKVGTNAEDVAIELGKSYPAPIASSYASYRDH
jgi:uncharacterized protein DUF3606